MTRADLLALDGDKLAALANRGLVKRAQKMLAKGAGPRIEMDGVTVVAIDGEVRTELPQGKALSDCPCSCSATKVCRHRIAAVLAYQEAFGGDAPADVVDWSPGTFSDDEVEARTGERAFARAKRRRSAGYVATLRRPRPGHDAPSAALPTCTPRFLVPNDLAHVRCDCAAKMDCEHVAMAVWAFREGDKHPSLEQIVEVASGERSNEGALRRTLDTIRTVLLEGVEGSGESLKATFAYARAPLMAAGMVWPADALEELESVLGHYHAWNDTYAVEEVSALLTELHARARSATRSSSSQSSASEPNRTPQTVVLGTGQAPETELAQVRLVGLGARVDTRQDMIRAHLFFADPGSQTTLVWKKSWPRVSVETDRFSLATTETERDSGFVGTRQLLGVPLSSLAGAQLVTQRATRRANCTLRLRRSHTARTSVTPQSGRWSELLSAPLLTVLSEEEKRRRDRPPRYVRARILTEAIRVVAVAEIRDLGFQGEQGALVAHAVDDEGSPFRIVLRERDVTPHAVRAGAQALSGDVRFVAGPLHRDIHGWFIEPLGIAGDAMCVPDLADSPTSDPLMPTAHVPAHIDPVLGALRKMRGELDALAQRGLRRAGARTDRVEEAQAALRTVGLHQTAARMDPLLTALRAASGSGENSSLADAWLDSSLRVDLALECI